MSTRNGLSGSWTSSSASGGIPPTPGRRAHRPRITGPGLAGPGFYGVPGCRHS